MGLAVVPPPQMALRVQEAVAAAAMEELQPVVMERLIRNSTPHMEQVEVAEVVVVETQVPQVMAVHMAVVVAAVEMEPAQEQVAQAVKVSSS